jgi:hypothetical protein
MINVAVKKLQAGQTQKRLQKAAPQLALIFPDHIATSQLAIWEPYLLASGFSACVCAKTCAGKKVSSKLPIFYQDEGLTISSLGKLSSIKVFLYVTNRPNNFNYLSKYPHIKHVFVGHGDSEKAASASRFSKVYDYLLVADDNAYMRYIKNKVELPRSSFIMMGAPTLPGLNLRAEKSSLQNILYAPTFEGKSDPANYSSLSKVAAALEETARQGAFKFCFRPHPGTGQRLADYEGIKNQLKAAINPEATPKLKIEQFNWSDAIVTDISGVLSEFLFTGKPIIIPASEKDELVLTTIRTTDLQRYVYVWDYTRAPLDSFLATIADDPLFKQRHQIRHAKFAGASTFEESSAKFCQAMQKLAAPELEGKASLGASVMELFRKKNKS